jgi:hypothetical protein
MSAIEAPAIGTTIDFEDHPSHDAPPSPGPSTVTWFLMLRASAILIPARGTVGTLLRTAGAFASGHVCTYRRVCSQARWSRWHFGCVPARQLVALLPDDAPIVLVGEDTSPPTQDRTTLARPAL